ncbi:beta-N-acetylhexosaminidase [Desulfobacula sp.]|uniref:beta-N-acetylhexosaminidase n=1 Tax=Desulfobacula sp. TaxID=2593537 RepID=UPI00261EC648|nr:beta-N-acetylhexosaminidase [Desulfobacula sp.]
MDRGIINQKVMAGQRLMLGFDGIELNEDLKHIIGDIKACGIILFKRNIETPEQVTSLCEACQDYARLCGIPPLFIAVDQEGGTVARFKEPFTVFRGNPFIESVQDARNFASITADELKQVGINMNFAPVLDIVPEGVDSIMKDRVFKGGAEQVSTLGMKVIHTLQENGIMAVAKHFPGIGRTLKDSHFRLPVLDIDLETLRQSDMIPFVAAKNEGVSGIMLSHISYPQLDSLWQASLSPFIGNGLLRSQMGYDGLVMTDDLDMKAIQHDMKTCIRQVLKSGIDMALICHKGPDIDKASHEIISLLNEDETLYGMGEKSVERILRIKKKYLQNPDLIYSCS